MSPTDLSATSLYGGIAYDLDFAGAALTPAEGDRFAGLLGDNVVLMIENRGPPVVCGTVSVSLVRLVYLHETFARKRWRQQ